MKAPTLFFTGENEVTILYEDTEYLVPENLIPALMESWNWVKERYDRKMMNRYTFLVNVESIAKRTLYQMGKI